MKNKFIKQAPVFNYLSYGFLVFEFSTIFLVSGWFLKKAYKLDNIYTKLNDFCFILSFFIARICFGPYWAFKTFTFFSQILDQLSPYETFLIIIFASFMIAITGLNFFWFKKIIEIAMGKKEKK